MRVVDFTLVRLPLQALPTCFFAGARFFTSSLVARDADPDHFDSFIYNLPLDANDRYGESIKVKRVVARNSMSPSSSFLLGASQSTTINSTRLNFDGLIVLI